MKTPTFALAVGVLAVAPAAFAHVTVSPKEAKPGAELMVTLHVGHGCDGAPTTEIKVDIPRQLTMAHPQDVPGWTLTSRASGGRTTTIDWKVKGAAPDMTPDFMVHIGLPKTEGPVRLPVTQTCGKTVEHWNETAGKDGKPPAKPAPTVTVSATASASAVDAMPEMHDHH